MGFNSAFKGLKISYVCGTCWGKKRYAYRVLVVETEGKGPLEMVQCRWDVKVKCSSTLNLPRKPKG